MCIKKDCYKLFSQKTTTFCLNCSITQRTFCSNIMIRKSNNALIVRSKTLKEKGFYCSLHSGTELDEKGLCSDCLNAESEAYSIY